MGHEHAKISIFPVRFGWKMVTAQCTKTGQQLFCVQGAEIPLAYSNILSRLDLDWFLSDFWCFSASFCRFSAIYDDGEACGD